MRGNGVKLWPVWRRQVSRNSVCQSSTAGPVKLTMVARQIGTQPSAPQRIEIRRGDAGRRQSVTIVALEAADTEVIEQYVHCHATRRRGAERGDETIGDAAGLHQIHF